jgi:hypothetical protein
MQLFESLQHTATSIKAKVITKGLRIIQSLIDRTTLFPTQRWLVLGLVFLYFLYRIIRYDYLGLLYFFGLYIIYLVVQYFTPSGLPDPDDDTCEDRIGLDEQLGVFESGERDRPVLRALDEFNLWKNLIGIGLLSLGCTMFELFLVPVYWPFLLTYFVWLIGLAVVKHHRHMELYGYRLGDFRGKGSLRVKNGGRC